MSTRWEEKKTVSTARPGQHIHLQILLNPIENEKNSLKFEKFKDKLFENYGTCYVLRVHAVRLDTLNSDYLYVNEIIL